MRSYNDYIREAWIAYRDNGAIDTADFLADQVAPQMEGERSAQWNFMRDLIGQWTMMLMGKRSLKSASDYLEDVLDGDYQDARWIPHPPASLPGLPYDLTGESPDTPYEAEAMLRVYLQAHFLSNPETEDSNLPASGPVLAMLRVMIHAYPKWIKDGGKEEILWKIAEKRKVMNGLAVVVGDCVRQGLPLPKWGEVENVLAVDATGRIPSGVIERLNEWKASRERPSAKQPEPLPDEINEPPTDDAIAALIRRLLVIYQNEGASDSFKETLESLVEAIK